MENFSPAELTELYFLARAHADTQFQFWISATFAVVVAGFAAGERLTRRLRLVIALLYVLATIVLLILFAQHLATAAGMAFHLSNAGASLIANTGFMGPVLVLSRLLLFFLGTGAALYFLLRMKKGLATDD